jgi:hypothetical protein
VLLQLRKLRARSRPERWLLIRATVALGLMRAAVGLLPFRTVARMVGLREGSAGPIPGEPGERGAQIGWAVRAAAAHTPWQSSCLTQALAAAALLRRSGIDGTLHLGVAKDASAPTGVIAHAWLLCGRLALTGGAERSRYAEIASFTLAGRDRRPSPKRP